MFGADYIVLYRYSMTLLTSGLGILEYKSQKHQTNNIKGDPNAAGSLSGHEGTPAGGDS